MSAPLRPIHLNFVMTRSSMMRRITALVAALAMSLILVGTVLAANAHQVGQTSVTVSNNTLTIKASIAGLGNVPSADFSLTGSVDVFSRCYNRGGNKPQADNKQETIAVNQTQTFPVRNGRTNVEFSVTPLSTLVCPGNQVVVIESFSWDLTISGQGVSIHSTGP